MGFDWMIVSEIVKWMLVVLFLSAVMYVHLRGRVRLNFWRQLFDHSSVMAPINVFMFAFSRTPLTPFIAVEDFPDLLPLQQHWREIRDEALALRDQEIIRAAQKNDDAGFNSFFKTGWKRFYLKWYGASHPSAEELCPRTVSILKNITSVKAAMFAELPPGGRLNRHRDPYGGSLRYHLGLVTPGDDRCFIEVDGQRYSWRDGQSVMFDETFIHNAENGSDQDRIILFCDIERPMKYRWAQAVNRFLGSTLVTAASSPNRAGDQTGLINKLFRYAWLVGQYRRRLKRWNKNVYLATKWALVAGIIGLIVIL
ncbi:MAG TPA: lipid A hydroxylase LpxO [Rhodocyclaceae bacterium]|nr:lipid A hydroxylase LpxO [Rhodocyclaceae bacterium]